MTTRYERFAIKEKEGPTKKKCRYLITEKGGSMGWLILLRKIINYFE